MKSMLIAFLMMTGAGTPLFGFPPEILSDPASSAGVRRNTFSIVAYDPERKEWGVGTASKVLAVGAGVPWAKVGTGAIATQSSTNVTYGPRGLELLAKGRNAKQVIDLLIKDDVDREDRQLAIVDAKGRPAVFTGKNCDGWHGHKLGKHHVCVGNLLAGKAVIEEMSAAFEKTKGPLAWRIMAALEAGEKAGGDKRGKQSAALLVVREPQDASLGDRVVDFRVDDHKTPIQELARILALDIPRVGE